jgi:hypothetical protein
LSFFFFFLFLRGFHHHWFVFYITKKKSHKKKKKQCRELISTQKKKKPQPSICKTCSRIRKFVIRSGKEGKRKRIDVGYSNAGGKEEEEGVA